MNRERFAWTISLVLIACLAFYLPSSLAQRDDDYQFVRTLVDIHRQVNNNYVDPIDENKLRQGSIDGLLSELDPFSNYVPFEKQEDFDRMLEGSFKGVGIQLNQNEDGRVEVVTPIEGSPAFKAGVLAGDIILKVNGDNVDGLRLNEVVKKIAGPLGSDVTLTVRHVTGDEADLKMTREEIKVPTVKGYSRNPDNSWDYYVCDDPKIAYIRVTQFTGESYQDLLEALIGPKGKLGQPETYGGLIGDGMKGLILDLRFNPGGRLDQAIAVVDLFVDNGVILKTKGRNRPEDIKYAQADGTLPKFPMVVLVNEHSASASEIVAGSLMDNGRALVIGQRSYGKGSVQEIIPLEGKSGELKLTVAYYYLPSGRLVHRKKDATDWGVEPQIVVPMDAVTEQRVLQRRFESELLRRPAVKTTTRPTTAETAAATTQPVDAQLQSAINSLLGFIVFQGERGTSPGMMPPPTRPVAVTAPATTGPTTRE